MEALSEKAKNIISDAMLYLYKYDPFYAYLLAQMQFRQSEDIPTLGVGYDNGTVKLVYNPKFVDDNEELSVAFLKHECGHILHKHLLMKQLDKANERMVMNIAMDSVINGNIEELYDRSSPAENIVKGTAKSNKPYVGPTHMISNPTAEEVYEKLMKLIPPQTPPESSNAGIDDSNKQNTGKGQSEVPSAGNGSFDDHSMFGNANEEEATIINKSIVENALSKNMGNVPYELSKLVQGILKAHTNINWRRELRKFSGNAVENGQYKTITKPNKKYGYPYFGRRTKYTGNIAISLDVSGSISDDDLVKFLGEMHTISRQTGLKLLIVQGDTEVADISKYSRKKIKKFVRKAGGGTELQPMINAAAKSSKFVVVFTDGYAEMPKKPNPRTHLMFILTKSHSDSFAKKASKIFKVVIMND